MFIRLGVFGGLSEVHGCLSRSPLHRQGWCWDSGGSSGGGGVSLPRIQQGQKSNLHAGRTQSGCHGEFMGGVQSQNMKP